MKFCRHLLKTILLTFFIMSSAYSKCLVHFEIDGHPFDVKITKKTLKTNMNGKCMWNPNYLTIETQFKEKKSGDLCKLGKMKYAGQRVSHRGAWKRVAGISLLVGTSAIAFVPGIGLAFYSAEAASVAFIGGTPFFGIPLLPEIGLIKGGRGDLSPNWRRPVEKELGKTLTQETCNIEEIRNHHLTGKAIIRR